MKKLFLSLFILYFCQTGHAFSTFLNSSKILQPGEYDISLSPQFFSGNGSGTNLNAFVDMAHGKRTNLRFGAGFGTIDFTLEANFKWMMIKEDMDSRPFNLGLNSGLEFASVASSINIFYLRAQPFISKKLTWEYGLFEPYLAPTLGIGIGSEGDTGFYSLLALGTSFSFEKLDYMEFYVETAFNLKNSSSYFALMATIKLAR